MYSNVETLRQIFYIQIKSCGVLILSGCMTTI